MPRRQRCGGSQGQWTRCRAPDRAHSEEVTWHPGAANNLVTVSPHHSADGPAHKLLRSGELLRVRLPERFEFRTEERHERGGSRKRFTAESKVLRIPGWVVNDSSQPLPASGMAVSLEWCRHCQSLRSELTTSQIAISRVQYNAELEQFRQLSALSKLDWPPREAHVGLVDPVDGTHSRLRDARWAPVRLARYRRAGHSCRNRWGPWPSKGTSKIFPRRRVLARPCGISLRGPRTLARICQEEVRF